MKRRILVVALGVCVGACGYDSSRANTADAFVEDCNFDSRAQTYTPGLTASSDDGVKVVLVSALPTRPVRFENTWQVQILDAQDQPMEASLVVEPFMPDHGHGTPQPPLPEAGTELGSYDMGPFDLWMPGIWELRMLVTRDEVTSRADFTFCIEE